MASRSLDCQSDTIRVLRHHATLLIASALKFHRSNLFLSFLPKFFRGRRGVIRPMSPDRKLKHPSKCRGGVVTDPCHVPRCEIQNTLDELSGVNRPLPPQTNFKKPPSGRERAIQPIYVLRLMTHQTFVAQLCCATCCATKLRALQPCHMQLQQNAQ